MIPSTLLAKCELCVLLSQSFLIPSETAQTGPESLPIEDKASPYCTIQCVLENDYLQHPGAYMMSFKNTNSRPGAPPSLILTLVPEPDTLYTKGFTPKTVENNLGGQGPLQLPDVVDTTHSRPSYSRTSTWLRDCMRDHVVCRKPNSGTRRLLRRLIHVGSTANKLRPYLQETSHFAR